MSKKAKRPKCATSASAEAPRIAVGRLALFKDPRFFESECHRVPPRHKRIVGLDLASNAGVGWCDLVPGVDGGNVPIFGSTWNLGCGSFDTTPLRLIRLQKFLEVIEPDLVIMERVRHTPNAQMIQKLRSVAAIVAKAATSIELIGAMCATAGIWCEQRNIPMEAVGIQEIKLFATGKGNSGKPEMIRAANERFGANLPEDNFQQTGADNVADAMFLCAMGVDRYSEAL